MILLSSAVARGRPSANAGKAGGAGGGHRFGGA